MAGGRRNFKIYCKKFGHVSNGVTHGNYNQCACKRWFMDSKEEGLTYDEMMRLLYVPPTPTTPSFSPSLKDLQNMTHPFIYLRDSPEEWEKLSMKTLLELIVHRLAEYEDGLDVDDV